MIAAGQRLPILIATRPVNFRCGHQALALNLSSAQRPSHPAWSQCRRTHNRRALRCGT